MTRSLQFPPDLFTLMLPECFDLFQVEISCEEVQYFYLFIQINSKEQLKNVSQINIYKYKYKEDFADSVGLPEHQRHDTGVIAQEVQTVLPDAVMETGDVALNSGKNVNNLLVVNKVSFMAKLHFLLLA